MRIHFFFVFFISCMTLVNAQTPEINKIKKSRNYITAQSASSESMEDASETARATLNLEIEQWLREKGEKDVAGFVAKSKENVNVIRTNRGNIFRAFVYVKKKDILPYYEDEDVVMENVESLKSQVGGMKSTVESVNSPSKDIQPVPKPSADGTVVINLNPVFVVTAFEKEMLSLHTFQSVTSFIDEKHRKGDIKAYGKFATLPTDTPCYVFIYNKEGAIPACLRLSSGEQVNLSTGEKDNIKNYQGCGALWFTTK